jgi:DnaJ-class molecular chaperone
MNNYNPYKILNIDEKCSLEEIKKAYRVLALKYHPDRNRKNIDDAEKKFKEISKAYTILIQCNGNYNMNTFSAFSKFNNFNNFGSFGNLNDLLNKGNIFKNFFSNLNIESITSNLLKEVILMSRYFEETKKGLPKTESLTINAKIELFDIYHNIEKTINITRKRKCESCLGIGFNLDEKFELCNECNGKKIFDKDVELKFKCKYKNIMFPGQSDEYDKYIAGNIYLNILPKDLRGYKIINDFDLLYIKYITLDEIGKSRSYSFQLKHFDNKNHTIKVENIILNKEYIIDNMGLYSHNSNKRNNLILMFMLEPSDESSSLYVL